MDLTLIVIRSAVTVALFLLFVLLCAYAWSGRRRAEFDAAARLPFDETDSVMTPTARERH
ncbi:MAG: CcoQ/FixQ family Cbb3-type cytochrome c oxidase assembly chaperone [Steroidobacteraceae bacterium]